MTPTDQTEVPAATTTGTDAAALAAAVTPDAQLRIAGELASRLLLSSRWQQ